ncbi:DUF1471 domain-containing protein [Budviciaceae bacterium CWB-B4]|uniref:DUF1471 domain-containing protein n=1 Tax=Limnobaculum xujianqingii TaxID=2738837 RepID=A0A9D7AHV1_9GAMM|nr:YdgH/BhsA/McbA-like domain containing protein [Limnobaculum xujianqingii]MBK5072999.1 DUF1471 domain-containing protein [Limnobaculum xujianqingii]MBK5176308.1 DUF1471 domain-containing protein [Limnobaculum xujianqingii]
MKVTKLVLAALMAGAFSVSAFAANQVNSGNGLNKVGSVSVSGASTLDQLERQLSQKADEAGASAYQIISAGGDNKLNGVAVIYK